MSLSIRTRLLGSYFILVALLVATGTFSYAQIGDLGGRVRNVGLEELPSLTLVRKIDTKAHEFRTSQLEQLLTYGASAAAIKQVLLDVQSQVDQLFIAYEPFVADLDRSLFQRARAEWATYRAQAEPFLDVARPEDVPGALAVLNGPGRDTFERLGGLLQEWLTLKANRVATSVQAADSSVLVARQLVIVVIAGSMLIALALGLTVSRSIIAGLQRAVAIARRVATGDLSVHELRQGHLAGPSRFAALAHRFLPTSDRPGGRREANVPTRDELGQLHRALDDMRHRLLEQRSALETDGRLASITNEFTELTALSEDDVSLSAATLATLDEIFHPDDAALHVSNQSRDRAFPQATLGDQKVEALSLAELGRCPAVRRSSLYIVKDVSARLSFRCPVYAVNGGTLACIPLIALGETIGAVHLHWSAVHDLSLPLRVAIGRISEHAALSLANRRLMIALRGQASTDGRTGLANIRSFDEALERQLAERDDRKPLTVLMLDLDHFKDFNDRHGHPAGDEALRVFADVLRSCVRDGDVAARYGGEEFAVSLPGLTAAGAMEIAERIRERTESTIVPLAPGVTGHLTVSIGIASAPDDASQRIGLLKAADQALYRAKEAGRNRVMGRDGSPGGAPSQPTPLVAGLAEPA